MAADSELDQSRAVVKTYVPAYQKAEWARHADQLGMSQSEFVRSMVQAGRRGFTGDGATSTGGQAIGPAGADDLEDRVLGLLSTDEHRSWEELREELSGGFEERLEHTLQSLTDAGRAEHSHRNGGYVLVEADER